MKKILITGAKGFLGSHSARYFKRLGYETYGIGHGDLLVDECKEIGLDYWYKSDVSVKAMQEINETFDVIVHCGGSGSVGFSVEHPYEDFKKTVDGTLEVLEYMRLYNSDAHLIYPSSPAVQGECKNIPIKESHVGKPVSPYGYHKKIAEDLCQSYAEKYHINISVIRFFSIYGRGLKKQLLWDAYNKIKASGKKVEFWGTGEETRDFIHIEDVFALMSVLLERNKNFIIINGGTGVKYTIKDVVYMIKTMMQSNIEITFNKQINIGNPIYFWADTKYLKSYNWEAVVDFEEGLSDFIQWANEAND